MSNWQIGKFGNEYSTIKIGGEFDYYLASKDNEEITDAIDQTKELGIPFHIIGGGSDLVFSDGKMSGLWIRIESETLTLIDEYVDENEDLPMQESNQKIVYADAGVLWGNLIKYCLDNGLKGLEDFARIPCRVGGAVFNNIHGENIILIDQYIESVLCYDADKAENVLLEREDCNFAYDQSIFQKNRNLVILGVNFLLEVVENEDELAIIKEKYKTNVLKKAQSQPSHPNCGCAFKNPCHPEHESHPELKCHPELVSGSNQVKSAGYYIDQAGCKGMKEGDLEVSQIHANFIENHGVGTQEDFIKLTEKVQAKVKEQFDIELELEVEII